METKNTTGSTQSNTVSVHVPGGFESLPNHLGCRIIVDYAHTPDGLGKILSTARQFTKGRLIVVFGCGGEQDRSKRPLMGSVAGKWADFILITSDNPRHENPIRIISDIESGLCRTPCSYMRIPERREAIFQALKIARAEDTLVIAGKGHEDFQIYGDQKEPFNDTKVVKEYFSLTY